MTRILELREALEGALHDILGEHVHWFEFVSTTQGDKIIRGPHICVTSKEKPNQKMVRAVVTLFIRLFGDVRLQSRYPVTSVNAQFGGLGDAYQFKFNLK